MQTLVERGCGMDVHQATVVACLLVVLKNGKVQKQIRTFGTTTRELLSLREWLLSEGCTHVAMESTGVYWKPIYAILEGAFEIVVANAQHVKKIPELELALEGKVEEHHRFLLSVQLRRLQAVEEDLGLLEQRLQEKLKPYAMQLALLQEIPGVDWTLGAVIISELGVDMSVFGNVSQMASWAGICPGNRQS